MGDAFTLHWSNGDARQLSSLWTDEGDMVHPDGRTERGRETIKTNRAFLFLQREYRGSKHPLTLGNIRCLNADVAVADGKWELRGVSDNAGKLLPTFEGLCTLVVQRRGGWRIEAYRYTQKPAAAPMPTLLMIGPRHHWQRDRLESAGGSSSTPSVWRPRAQRWRRPGRRKPLSQERRGPGRSFTLPTVWTFLPRRTDAR